MKIIKPRIWIKPHKKLSRGGKFIIVKGHYKKDIWKQEPKV